MRGALIPVQDLHLGQRILLVPTRADTAAGGGQGPIQAAGEVVALREYHFGLIQRGSALAYEPEAPPAPAAVPAPELAELAPQTPAEEPSAPTPSDGGDAPAPEVTP